MTALHIAAQYSSDSVVRALLEAGADIEVRDIIKRTPLRQASAYNSSSVVKVLIEAGADVNALDYSQQSPLHQAAKCNWSIVPMLLAANAKVNVLDRDNFSPLFYAAKKDEKDGVTSLINAGADPNLGVSPLTDSSVKAEMKALIRKLTMK